MKKIVVIFITVLGMASVVFSQGQSVSSEQQVQQVDPFEDAVKKLSSPDTFVRRQAAEQLGMLRDPRAIPHLMKLLKDKEPFVRQSAIDSLGLLRSREATKEIISILLKDKEPQVRQSAAIALGYIGDLSAVAPLTEVVKSTMTHPPVRYAACNSLGVLRSTEPIPVLISLLSDPDINLRRSVVYTLRQIPHPESISALRALLGPEQDENLLVDIIRTLAENNDKDSIEKIKLLSKHSSYRVSFYSAVALAKLAEDKTVLPIIKKGLTDKNEQIKIDAIDATVYVGDHETLTMLKSMYTQEGNPYIKELLRIRIQQLERKLPPKPAPKPTTTTPRKR